MKIRKNVNKCKRKPMGQSRIDNPDKQETLGTQDTTGRQIKQITQHWKLKRWATWTLQKTMGKPGCSRRVSSSCFL